MARIGRAPLLALAAGVLGAAGCADLTGGGAERARTVVSVDLSAARSAIPGAVTVADRVVLTVTPENGEVQRLEEALGREELGASFPVTVEEGRVEFGLEVLNRAGTVLFSGEAVEEIATDGFGVTIDLLPRAPFMVARPDSVEQGADPERSIGILLTEIEVSNLGLDTLSWAPVGPAAATGGGEPLPACGRAQPQPCVRFSFEEGRLRTGESETLVVRATAPREQAYRLRIASNVGEVEVAVVVPAPFSGRGTAVIDGRIAAEEWGGAAAVEVPIGLPGGRTAPGTFRIMADGENLYLSLGFPRDAAQWFRDHYALAVDFDDDADGFPALFDDGLTARVFEPEGLATRPGPVADDHRASLPPCGDPDPCRISDGDADGTHDGIFAAANDGLTTVIEVAKPLRTTDGGLDLSLAPGRMVGFQLSFDLFDGQSVATTVWPTPDHWAVFLVP